MRTREEIVSAIAHELGRKPEHIDAIPDIEDLVDALRNGDCIDKDMCGNFFQTMCGSLQVKRVSGWQIITAPAPKKE